MYCRKLNLDRTKIAKSLEYKLSRAVEEGDSLAIDLAWQDLERKASERYKGYVVRSSLKRVTNEALKCNSFAVYPIFGRRNQLYGLPYEVYMKLLHIFEPILMDTFCHWFPQGAIPGSVTKYVITLLKKGGRHVWEGFDNYRPITLLNTELKILARVLANHL